MQHFLSVVDSAPWTGATLISKCEITSLSSLYKDCLDILKEALCRIKQEETKRRKKGECAIDGVCFGHCRKKALENISVQSPIWDTQKRYRNHIGQRAIQQTKTDVELKQDLPISAG